jgi:hypothetical protein
MARKYARTKARAEKKKVACGAGSWGWSLCLCWRLFPFFCHIYPRAHFGADEKEVVGFFWLSSRVCFFARVVDIPTKCARAQTDDSAHQEGKKRDGARPSARLETQKTPKEKRKTQGDAQGEKKMNKKVA